MRHIAFFRASFFRASFLQAGFLQTALASLACCHFNAKRFTLARVTVVALSMALTQCAQPPVSSPAKETNQRSSDPSNQAPAAQPSNQSSQHTAGRHHAARQHAGRQTAERKNAGQDSISQPKRQLDSPHAKQLQRLSLEWLRKSPLQTEHLSLYLFDLAQQQLILEHRSDQPMQPASVMKLMTTSAALDLLGSTYRGAVSLRISPSDASALAKRAPTAALYALQQPLVIYGEGHNQLQRRDVQAIDETLKRLGIAAPSTVVLDRRWMPLAPVKPFDENPWSWYNVAPDALLLEQNTQWYHLSANAPQMSLRIAGIDEPIQVDSKKVRWNEQQCRQNALQQLHFQWRGTPQRPLVEIRGDFPRQCYLSGYAQLLPRDWGWQAAWQQVWPTARLLPQLPKGAATVEIARLEDEPLAVRIRSINKDSDNVQARTLFAALSTAPAPSQQTNQSSASTDSSTDLSTDLNASAKRLTAWLHAKGIDTRQLVFENGAGLSRSERLTASALGDMLRWQWQQPTRFEFVSSLPIAGVDGTLKTRFAGQAAEQCARLKTGTLRDTTALAGYLLPQNGQGPYVLVAILNDEQALSQGIKSFNSWVNQLCQAQ